MTQQEALTMSVRFAALALIMANKMLAGRLTYAQMKRVTADINCAVMASNYLLMIGKR